MSIGVSFLDNLAGKIEQAEKEQDRYQQAVRVISMRVPRLMGGGAIAPAPLLQGQGGQGSPFTQGPVAQAFARMGGLPPQQPQGMVGPQAPMRGPQPPMAMPQAAMPTPRIIPGITSPDDLARSVQPPMAPQPSYPVTPARPALPRKREAPSPMDRGGEFR